MNSASTRSRSLTRLTLMLFAAFAGLGAAIWWLAGVSMGDIDPLFQSKPESEWIRNLKYSDEEQVKEWRSYGEEGVEVLIRGLHHANRPGERAYRRLYPRLPGFVARRLSAPKSDSTHRTRLNLVSMISSLGGDAMSATRVMAGTLNDESESVRALGITFFTAGEDEKCPLNQLPAKQKKALLPAFIRAMEDNGNLWLLRNNAAIALRYYAEQPGIVVPVLVKALGDAQPQVCLRAAEALHRLDPEAAKRAGVLPRLTEILKNPDDQISWRAALTLGTIQNDPEPAIVALIEGLENTNCLVASACVWSLQQFTNQPEKIIRALEKATQRKDSSASHALAVLKNKKDRERLPSKE